MANTFTNASLTGVGTTEQTLYTVPAGKTAVVIGLTLANTTGNQVAATVKRSNVTYFSGLPIPANGSFDSLSGKLVLTAGQTIKVSSNTASSLNAFIDVLEQS